MDTELTYSLNCEQFASLCLSILKGSALPSKTFDITYNYNDIIFNVCYEDEETFIDIIN